MSMKFYLKFITLFTTEGFALFFALPFLFSANNWVLVFIGYLLLMAIIPFTFAAGRYIFTSTLKGE